MKIIYTLILISFLSLTSKAQKLNKFYFEAGFVSKLSIGEPTRKTIRYKLGVSANVPNISKFNNIVSGLNFNFNYRYSPHLFLGIGSGINIVKFERHPITANEYHDKVFVPVYLSVGYLKSILKDWIILSDLNAGYQFYDFRYGNTENGFYFKETGGLILNLNIGLGRKVGKYTPMIKFGYELNQFSHENSLGWINHDNLKYDDKIRYKTYYHLIRLAMSIKI